MRGLSISTAISAALFLLSPVVNAEPHSPHASMARRHMHNQHRRNEVVKRGQCEFPTDAGLVAVTPDQQNAGWAMSPDQPCKPGMSSDIWWPAKEKRLIGIRNVLSICLPSRSIDGSMGSFSDILLIPSFNGMRTFQVMIERQQLTD